MPKQSSARKPLTRQEQRDLDVEIGFLEGLIRRDPHYADALIILGDNYTRRGRIEDGLRVDEALSQLRPADPVVRYNLACSLALAGQFDATCAALEQALDLGYADFHWLARDPDLAGFRKHPLYRRIRARLRSARSRERRPEA